MSKMPLITMSKTSNQDVYNVLSDIFEFPDEEQKLWWHSTAPMFAEMLQVACCDIHYQYRYLGVFKKHIIPFLGIYPINERDRWLSILTRFGTPFELSLNCSNSVVRYTYEPINAATGTTKDPFNTHAIWDSLHKLIAIQPHIDTEWFNHFKNDLTLNSEESAYLLESDMVKDQIKTQNKLALDLKGGQFVLKVYIYPTLKALATGRSAKDLMFDSVRRLSHRYQAISPALSILEEYVHSRSGPDSTVSPRLLSCDLIDPNKSRVKIYLLERMVSLDAMTDLWTLGGRRNDQSTYAGLEMIRELWDLLKIPPGIRSYPAPYLPLGTIPDERLPSMANYTLHHDDSMPEPQVYLTVFGMNDMEVAAALETFFERRGWTEMAQRYKNGIKAY